MAKKEYLKKTGQGKIQLIHYFFNCEFYDIFFQSLLLILINISIGIISFLPVYLLKDKKPTVNINLM